MDPERSQKERSGSRASIRCEGAILELIHNPSKEIPRALGALFTPQFSPHRFIASSMSALMIFVI